MIFYRKLTPYKYQLMETQTVQSRFKEADQCFDQCMQLMDEVAINPGAESRGLGF